MSEPYGGGGPGGGGCTPGIANPMAGKPIGTPIPIPIPIGGKPIIPTGGIPMGGGSGAIMPGVPHFTTQVKLRDPKFDKITECMIQTSHTKTPVPQEGGWCRGGRWYVDGWWGSP